MTGFFVFAWLFLAPDLVGGKCSICLYEGHRSTVQQGPCMSTLVYCPPYYDEDGKLQIPNCNPITCSMTCSRGHVFAVHITPAKKDR